MQITEREARESARGYAMRVIKENIIHLGLLPGSMVSEQELAAELGLSRGPVREALIELTKVKMVEVYPQRGSYISPVDYELVDEACFMREALEIAVAERCCLMGVMPAHLTALRENLNLQQFYSEGDNTRKFWELDNEFHRLLFLNAGVIRVHTLMSSMLTHFDRVRAMALAVIKKGKLVEDHHQILEAIISGNSGAAKSLMHRHLTSYQIDRQAVCDKYPQYIKH
ncbi:MAG: GntR family transcriptional regulator [Synergistaceae bacterium]|nr:GntR family transcriptional regulator [Synergistaceae bacterium]